MLKKLLIMLMVAFVLVGCKGKEEKPDETASASPSVSAQATDSTNENKDNTATNKPSDGTEPMVSENPSTNETKGPLKAPDVPDSKPDPKRTAEIPETPNPEKVNKDKNIKVAGSGIRSEEVSTDTVQATSTENAVTLATQFMKNNNTYIPSNVEVDREDENFYYVHAYELMSDSEGEHKSTVGWFNVNKKDSSVVKGEAPIKVGERPDSK